MAGQWQRRLAERTVGISSVGFCQWGNNFDIDFGSSIDNSYVGPIQKGHWRRFFGQQNQCTENRTSTVRRYRAYNYKLWKRFRELLLWLHSSPGTRLKKRDTGKSIFENWKMVFTLKHIIPLSLAYSRIKLQICFQSVICPRVRDTMHVRP